MEHILQRGRLIVGVKTDYPPWGMVAPDGSIVGLEPDLARDAAERLGVALELVPVTAGNRLQRLIRGRSTSSSQPSATRPSAEAWLASCSPTTTPAG